MVIPLHASAPVASLKVEPPVRACSRCHKAKDEVLSRQPLELGFYCYDCRCEVVR